MPGNDLARQIKEHLTARQVVELYGFHPDRGGYIQCPFHTGDNHGSLKVYDGSKTGWHCFGCGAGGSVIDFVMRLFGLSFAQACLKLNCDFGLGLTGELPSMAERSALLEARRREAQEKEVAAALYREKAAEYRQLKDDVAVPDSTYSTGRRGIAGTVFVHKIAGAKAAKGASLAEVKTAAEKAIANVRSMGTAMSSCIIPGVGKPGFELAEDEIEIGMGIHGEPGVERTTVKTAKELAGILLKRILDDYQEKPEEVALMVNGLGATPQMELYILNNEVHKLLEAQGIKVSRTYVGNFMTALEMAGCSLTLLKLDDELKELLDEHSDAPAFRV